MPPSFYDDDIQKWTKKFETARESRQQWKTKLKSLGCFMPLGTKNTNTMTSKTGKGKTVRRNSRMSTNTFNAVDFEYSGNTNNVQHLIASTTQAARHPTQLNFELNLRTYRNESKFKGNSAWQYPPTKEHYDPVGLDKPSFGHTFELTKGAAAMAKKG